MTGARTPFTKDDDILLMKYIARYNPDKSGRQGNALYQKLEANDSGRWKWAAHHPWQSWRERYKKKQPWFDQKIKTYQKKKGINAENSKQQIVIRKKAARRRHGVDEGQTDQDEEDQLQRSEKGGAAEKKKKRKRIAERADGPRKKAKRDEEEEASIEGDTIEISSGGEGQESVQNSPRVRRSSPRSRRERGDGDSTDDGGEPARPDGYSGEVSWEAEASEIVEPENVGSDDDTQDDGGEDVDVDETINGHPGSTSRTKDATSRSKQTASPPKPIAPMHSTLKGPSGKLYPDISDLPSPMLANSNNANNAGSQLPGAFNPPINQELLPEDKNVSQQNSQEPTPPLSNVDSRSPRPEMARDAHKRREGSQVQSGRKSVFPGGDYRSDLPVRTNTLDLQSSPSELDRAAADDANGVMRAKTTLKLKKRKRSSADENEDSDFFESFPPTPGHENGVKKNREPPKLIEGPFGSAFTDGRAGAPKTIGEPENSEDEDEENEDPHDDRQGWPPRRSSYQQTDIKGKGKAGSIAPNETLSTGVSLTTTDSSSSRVASKSEDHRHPFSQPNQEYEAVMAQYFAPIGAVASSSEAPHDTHHPFSQTVGRFNSTASHEHDAGPSHSPIQPRKNYRMFAESLPDPSRITPGLTHAQVADSKGKRAYQPLDRAASDTSAPLPISRGSTSSKIELTKHLDKPAIGNARISNYSMPRESSSGSSSDPFLVPKVTRRKHDSESKAKEKAVILGDYKDRRKTFGGIGTSAVIPKIDLTLRTKPLHRRIFLPPRQSLPAFPTAAGANMEENVPSRRVSTPTENLSTPSSALSSPSNMSTTDRSIAVRLGVDAMVQRMSDNHGFTIDVIRRVYDAVSDFQLTDAVLTRMRESAEVEAISCINTSIKHISEHPPRSRSSSPRRVSYPFPGLQYTPVAVDNVGISEYSPPETSRAGQYTKLAKQGRRYEALKREGKRVSLGRTADFLRNIQMSEGASARAISGDSDGIDGQSPESALAPVDHAHNMAMSSPAPQQPVWGEEEDRLLHSGNPQSLKDLETKMGKVAFKRRIAEIHMASV